MTETGQHRFRLWLLVMARVPRAPETAHQRSGHRQRL